MQIWIYRREAQIGDYVFADATTSDILNKAKTVVGICFYIDPKNKTQRLCVALQDLNKYQWGLHPNDWPEGISLADTPNYNVFDVQGLTNKTAGSNIFLNESNYRDESSAGDADGFKIQLAGTAMAELGWEQLTAHLGGYQEGTKLPYGLINTLKIIEHRDIILTDSNVNLPVPARTEKQSELVNLDELMSKVVSDHAGQAKYREFYFPAASQCHAYEPGITTGETLKDCFKAGNWYLPSVGEMARLCWWSSHNKLQEVTTNGIFAPHIASGIFTALGTSWFWCSTEGGETNAWGAGASDSNLNFLSKSSSLTARAIAAF